MKIVIAGGVSAADYIIKNFKGRSHKLTIINGNRDDASYLAKSSKLPVFFGDPTKSYILKDAHIEDSDVFIALGFRDADNYVACMLAKRVFNVKKCICIVSNPKNIEVFKELGIDSVISSTEQLVSSIIAESSLEQMIKTMSLEDDKIVLTEIVIKSNFAIAHKHIMEINFPKTGSIACIYRRPRVIIPNGSTLILPKDKLVIVSTPNATKDILKFVQKDK